MAGSSLSWSKRRDDFFITDGIWHRPPTFSQNKRAEVLSFLNETRRSFSSGTPAAQAAAGALSLANSLRRNGHAFAAKQAVEVVASATLALGESLGAQGQVPERSTAKMTNEGLKKWLRLDGAMIEIREKDKYKTLCERLQTTAQRVKGDYDKTFSLVGSQVYLGLWEDKTSSSKSMEGHLGQFWAELRAAGQSNHSFKRNFALHGVLTNLTNFMFGYYSNGKVHLSARTLTLGVSTETDELIADCMLRFKDSILANARAEEERVDTDDDDEESPPPGGGGRKRKRQGDNSDQGRASKKGKDPKDKSSGGRSHQRSGQKGQNNQDLDLDMCDDAESLFYQQLPTMIALSSSSGVKSIRPQLDSLSSGESTLHSNFVQQYLTDVWTSRSEKA